MTGPATPATAAKVGGWTLARVFLRSLSLQATWNPRGMQNLGFAFALLPALARLYPDPADLERAVKRHLTPFNTHPYAAAAVLGGCVRVEERVARGEEPAEAAEAFKQALMGPLAAVFDGFFWLALRPACGALGALLAWPLGTWAILVALACYDGVHLALRLLLFRAGLRGGEAVLGVLTAWRLSLWSARFKALAALCAGAAAALAAFRLPAAGGHPLVVGGLAWGLFLLGWGLLTRGLSPYLLAFGAAGLAAAFGLVL